MKEEPVFSPAQREAVSHRDGPMLVIAGPGAGKTTVITTRLRKMTEEYGIRPEEILVITFTRAAAREMQERYQKLTGRPDRIRFGTFHSIFYEWLRSWGLCRDSALLTEEERVQTAAPYFRDLYEMKEEEAREKASAFLSEYDKLRNEGRNLSEVSAFLCCERDVFLEAVHFYRKEKELKKKIDYEDMQQLLWETLEKEPGRLRSLQARYRYFLIDEFQDINPIQYKILRSLSSRFGNLFAVGDEDQSIYGFRGSSPSFLLHFSEDFPGAGILRLQENYRCRQPIGELSQKLIRHNRLRYEKDLQSVRKGGESVRIFCFSDPEQEAIRIRDGLAYFHREKGLPYEAMAVLYRTHQRAEVIGRALTEGGIPFRSREKIGSFYDHWMAREMRAYLRLREQPEDREAFLTSARLEEVPEFMIREAAEGPGALPERLAELPALSAEQRRRAEEFFYHFRRLQRLTPAEAMRYLWQRMNYGKRARQYADRRFIPARTLYQQRRLLWDSAEGCADLQEWEARREAYEKALQGQEQGVCLSTMHGAKGLEFPLVWCAAVSAGVLPHPENEDLEEERRILYVGLTRARDYLLVSGYGLRRKRSLFMEEIKEKKSREKKRVDRSGA